MRELFPKQKSKFVDAVKGADRAVFGGLEGSSPSQTSQTQPLGGSSGGDEGDLDHEEDGNILGRLERELKRLEVLEEAESNVPTASSSP